MKRVVGAAVVGILVGLAGIAEAQIRMEQRTRTITEYYIEYQTYTRTYQYYVSVPYTVNQTCCCRSVYNSTTRTYTQQSYSCPRTLYRSELRYYTYTYQYPVYKTRTRTVVETVAVPDTKALTDRLDLEREVSRIKQALEADIARVAGETQDLFNKNRLTEDFQLSSESLGDERFLEQFAAGSLARAVHVAR